MHCRTVIAWILLTVCHLLPLAVRAQNVSIRVQLSSEQVDEITFDKTRVAEEQVRKWILLSKDGPYNEDNLASCIELQDDPDSKRFVQDRASFLRVTSELENVRIPRELSEVVQYLRKIRSLWFWIDTQQVSFIRNRRPSGLEKPYEDIVPEKTCALSVEKVRSSTSPADAVNTVCFEWGNCALETGVKRIGSYPTDAWQAFLSAYGIHERIISTEQ